MVGIVGQGGQAVQAAAQHAPKWLRDKMGGRMLQKTIGNLPPGMRNEKDILKLIKQLDGDASGVWKNAIDQLKKIKNIDMMGTSAGVSSLAQQAMTQALAKSGAAKDAENIDDEDIRKAIEVLKARLVLLAYIQFLLETIEEAAETLSNPAVLPGEYMSAILDNLEKLNKVDLYFVPAALAAFMFETWVKVFIGFEAHPTATKAFPTGMVVTLMVSAEEAVDLRYAEDVIVDPPGLALVAKMRSTSVRDFSDSVEDELDTAATDLNARIAATAEFDDVEQIINEAVEFATNELKARVLSRTLTTEFIMELLARLTAMIKDRGLEKIHGAGMNSSSMLGNAANLIPQVGSLVQKFMQDFLPKSINDKQKITQSMQRFTENIARNQKKREATSEVLQPNQEPQDEQQEQAQAPAAAAGVPTGAVDPGPPSVGENLFIGAP